MKIHLVFGEDAFHIAMLIKPNVDDNKIFYDLNSQDGTIFKRGFKSDIPKFHWVEGCRHGGAVVGLITSNGGVPGFQRNDEVIEMIFKPSYNYIFFQFFYYIRYNYRFTFYNNTCEIYIQLAENSIIKEELDRFLFEKDKNKDKQKLTFDESKSLLFEYCDINKIIPTGKTKYKNYNIGKWLQSQKHIINNNKHKRYI